MSQERAELNEPSWMAAPLRALTTWVVERPGLVLGASLAITLLSILITVTGLKFKMSRLDLLNPQSEYNQRWLAYLEEFSDEDDAVVVVQGANTDDVLAAIDDIAAELKRPGQPYTSVLSEWDLTSFRSKGLHFVPREAVLHMERELSAAGPLLESSQQAAAPLAELRRLNDQLQSAERLSDDEVRFVHQRYGQLLESLGAAAAASSSTLPAEGLNDLDRLEEGLSHFKSHHLLMNDGQMGFVLLRLKEQAGEVSRGANAIKSLRTTLDHLKPQHPNVQIGLTGMPILEFDEMTASADDMTRSTWLSFVCVFLFFGASFGSWRHTLFAVATLLIGMVWSFGYLTLVIGHLNILSVAFAAILIGIGIDFAIHYVSHYLGYRSRGMSSAEALIETATCVGPGVVTGAITTAFAFFTAAFTEFVGIVELGLIAGGGILLCLVATVFTLPAMIQLADANQPYRELSGILKITSWLAPAKRFPKATLLATIGATVLIATGLTNLRYDHNLLNLQPVHLESVEIERQVLGGKDQSFWCALSMADSPEHARALKERFEGLSTVARVEEVGTLFPEEDAEVRRAIIRISNVLDQLPQHTAPLGESLGGSLGSFDATALDAELRRAEQLLHRATAGQSPLLAPLAQSRQGLMAASRSGEALQEQFAGALPLLRSLHTLTDPEAPQLADLPQPIADRFIGQSGKFLVRVYAKGHIWDMDALKRFVAEVEGVDERITGHPVQTFYASRHMQRSYVQAALYSLLCVFGVLLLDYRNLKHTLLAMLPLAFGVAQMLGIMGLLGIPFNPANMIALPLILGMGVEDGVHLMHEYRRRKGRFQLSNSTAVAVMLTSATTISGFACMIVARHQGLQSLGQILTFGMTTCMVVSLYALPALLRWRTSDRPDLAEETEETPAVFVQEIDDAPNSMGDEPPLRPLHEPARERIPIRLRIRPTRTPRDVISLLGEDRAA
jgi:uncharacterized protein